MQAEEYRELRERLLAGEGEKILSIERQYMDLLLRASERAAPRIYRDYERAAAYLPFWMNYAPKQRGRQPTGESIPWGEVGETTLSANMVKAILEEFPEITFPGLPFGGDIRFATGEALVHLDTKSTGPNDNPDELVVSPYQVSGDGVGWDEKGLINSKVLVRGSRGSMEFQPELPPFYMEGDQVLVCLTYFLKAVYTVESLGMQPLDYLELACVPNGLLVFEGRRYFDTAGLFIPGKDVKSHPHKRTRIRLDPLASIADWRCVRIYLEDGRLKMVKRADASSDAERPRLL
jgi:hypothetical protein